MSKRFIISYNRATLTLRASKLFSKKEAKRIDLTDPAFAQLAAKVRSPFKLEQPEPARLPPSDSVDELPAFSGQFNADDPTSFGAAWLSDGVLDEFDSFSL
jgi:hypothetical protein